MLLIFLDTETTGLDPEKHRAIEIAFKVVDAASGRVITGYDSIISQSADVWAEADPRSLEINGFSWEDLLKGKSEKVVATEISNDLNHAKIGQQAAVFVCQNPSFDRAFFHQLISVDEQYEYHWPYHWLDLASMFWAISLLQKNIPTEESKLSKNAIAKHYGLPNEQQPHRAMNGVNHLIACYNALFSERPIDV